MVNSGSSANLLSLAACGFKKGSQVITLFNIFDNGGNLSAWFNSLFYRSKKNKFISDVNQIELI